MRVSVHACRARRISLTGEAPSATTEHLSKSRHLYRSVGCRVPVVNNCRTGTPLRFTSSSILRTTLSDGVTGGLPDMPHPLPQSTRVSAIGRRYSRSLVSCRQPATDIWSTGETTANRVPAAVPGRRNVGPGGPPVAMRGARCPTEEPASAAVGGAHGVLDRSCEDAVWRPE